MATNPELFTRLYVAAFPSVVDAYFNGTLKAKMEGEVSYNDVASVTEDLANIAHQYLLRSLQSLPQDDMKLQPLRFRPASTAPPSKIPRDKHHQPWTAEEDTQLETEFRSGMDNKAIAAAHNRSELAIQSRLIKLKLVTP